MSRGNRPPPKDMYWFAHGGPESEKNLLQRNSVLFDGEDEGQHASNSPTWNATTERRASPDEQRPAQNVTDGGSHSSGPPSLERDDRLRISDKRIAVEERRKQLWEAEQERNDAVLRKHMEREAALEARRNASRSNIAFAFGSSIPRNVETLQVHESGESDIMSRSFTSGSSHREETHDSFHNRRSVSPLNYNGHISLVHDKSPQSNPSQSCTTSYSERRVMSPSSWLFGSGALIGEDVMSKSMIASSAPRGRRKNDLMPTVPYDRTATPRAATSSSTRKRSVSMTRLDQLALPRKHYVEANKASSSASSANSSMLKDNVRSPTRPLSSASENSGGSGRVPGSVTRRIRSTPRKPRPVSIAGTLPEQRQVHGIKPFEVKVSPVKKSYTPSKQSAAVHSLTKSSTPKSVEKVKQAPRLSTPPKLATPKPTTPRTTVHKSSTPMTPKQTDTKQTAAKQAPKTPTPKAKEKKPLSTKKKTDIVTPSALTGEERNQVDDSAKSESPPPALDNDVAAENEKNNAKRIISEEEAKTALAEKRRLAREQAEREAELERQRQEQLRLEEEERLRQEEEEHRKMEEEQMRLLKEHRRQEEEKLRKAIEGQEQKEEEERAKRDEEMRLKAEQEKKAKEEAEKQRLELEEKLRKEEIERAERKKRLEKIMSRTRGKSSGTSPSGSMSGSDQLDSCENPQEGFSSGANSLDSNEAELPSEQASISDQKAHIFSGGDSLEANPTYEIGSENESLNSNDLMMPISETASQDNSLVIVPDKDSADVVTSSVSEETATLPSSQLPEGVIDLQESSTVNTLENSDNLLADGTDDAGMEEMVTSMIAEPVYTQEMDHSNVDSEVSLQECQYQNQLESGQALVDVMSPVEIPETNFGPQSQLLSGSNLPEEVENQQDLGEFDKPQIPSDKTEVEIIHQETSEEHSSQHDLNAADSLINIHFPDETNIEVSALDSEMFENQARSSVSSDIKLPDPIYETSEDGSITSEKHQTFGMQDEFGYNKNQENIADDIFSQQVILPDPESAPQNENPFEMNAFNANQNPFTAEYPAHRSDVDLNESSTYDMNGSIYETREPNVFNQEYEMGENQENVLSSQPLTSNIIEADVHQNERAIADDDSFYQGSKENIPSEIISDIPASQPSNQFNDGSIFSNGTTELETISDPLADNEVAEPSAKNQAEVNFELNSAFDQTVSEKQQDANLSFDQQEVDDVTIIKADDSGACVGIISSVDHDQTSNNFSKPNLLNEQLKNNFESASMTDSEDNSSLDSNLSQVMTAEGSEKDTVEGLNHVEVSELSKNGFSNGDKHNPFDIGNMYNDSFSKSSVNNFHASEMFSNGHSLESSTTAAEQMSELPDYVHLGGNSILSVDHPKNNIFENADAIDYGKVSPDPFLVKGNSNQIPGNPFLLQDDQKQVLMAPDFLN